MNSTESPKLENLMSPLHTDYQMSHKVKVTGDMSAACPPSSSPRDILPHFQGLHTQHLVNTVVQTQSCLPSVASAQRLSSSGSADYLVYCGGKTISLSQNSFNIITPLLQEYVRMISRRFCSALHCDIRK